MQHHDATRLDRADLPHHRATVGAVVWAALLFAACIAALLDEPAQPLPSQAAAVAASAAPAARTPTEP